jgi:hypothetical protein
VFEDEEDYIEIYLFRIPGSVPVEMRTLIKSEAYI